jgi:poly(beta-D-mannuronate) C5 epimerase
MVDGQVQKQIRGLLAALMLCAPLLVPSSLWAGPDPALIKLDQQLTELSDILTQDRAALRLSLAQLMQRTGLAGLTPDLSYPIHSPVIASQSTYTPTHMASATVEDFRTALALLTQVHGGQDNLGVLTAHPDERTKALTFRSGLVTLDHIRASLAQAIPQAQMQPWDNTLRVPIILWEDAVLQLGPEDHLQLSRRDGAFIISFGRVEITGSRVSAVGDASPTSKDFVPFVTIGGGGAMQIDGAIFQGLGFGTSPKFSGLSVVAHPLLPSVGETRITDSHFEDVHTVSLTGISDAMVSGNQFYNMRNNALLLSASKRTKVYGNLFFGAGPTNAIRVSRGSDHSTLQGNVLLQGDRSGILVQGQSNHVEVSGNVIWRRDGGAIKISKSNCVVLHHNMILNSRQKGVDIRASNQITVQANTIIGNRSAGIWVSDQRKGAVTYVSDNTLRQNKAGLSTATGGQLMLVGNDLSDQFPRMIEGDIALQNRAIVTNLRGDVPMLMSAGETQYPVQAGLADCEL